MSETSTISTEKGLPYNSSKKYTDRDLLGINAPTIPLCMIGERWCGDFRVLHHFKTGLVLGVTRDGNLVSMYSDHNSQFALDVNNYAIVDGVLAHAGIQGLVYDWADNGTAFSIELYINTLKRVKLIGVVNV